MSNSPYEPLGSPTRFRFISAKGTVHTGMVTGWTNCGKSSFEIDEWSSIHLIDDDRETTCKNCIKKEKVYDAIEAQG